MKKYTYITILLFTIFILFCQQTTAQEREKLSNHPEIQSLIALSKTIESGEIHLQVNKYKKGKADIETKEYKMTFYKTENLKDMPLIANTYYNLLNVTDSIQYVYNGEMLCEINHKKKSCNVDTSSKIMTDPVSLFYPSLFIGEMASFYVNQFLNFSWATSVEDVQKTGDVTLVKLETYCNPKKSKDPCPEKWEREICTEEYEWNTSESTLLRYSKTAKDDENYSSKTAVKTETVLTTASLNKEEYADALLYNGLNYAKSYRISYAKCPKK